MPRPADTETQLQCNSISGNVFSFGPSRPLGLKDEPSLVVEG